MMLSYDAAPKASASNYQLLDTARALLNSLHQQEGIVLLYEFQERSPIPIPALFNALDEARFFASLAGPKELEAYCWACFDAMKPKRQQDFIRYVMKGEQE